MAGAAPPPPATTSAARIAAAAKAAGINKIDFLLITHYHVDHVGGLQSLLELMPVGTFIDHGPNRETPPAGATPAQLAYATSTLYPKYLASIAGKKHIVMKPGQTLNIDGLVLTAINADGVPLAKPLPGAGKPGLNCAAATTQSKDGGEENTRSLGIVATWGKARILSLGDTIWNLENQLACARDLIGPVDLMFTTHHGSNLSGSPLLYSAVKPTVAITMNGPTKGGDPEVFDTLMASPRIKGVWQLHTAIKSGPDKNPPPEQIANLAEGPDAANPLQVVVDKSGIVTVTNTRNNVSKTYPKAL